jgi:hypothetical protein
VLFSAEVDNARELDWAGNGIATGGVDGYANQVTIAQKFVCDSGIDLQRIVTRNHADEANFAATNSLGVSLDGKTVLVEKATTGRANGDELVLELGEDRRFAGVREFWVHMTMRNGCGIMTLGTNRITELRIEGVGTTRPES